MALFDSADLLARVKRLAHRPSSDEEVDDTDWYGFLTDAQIHWAQELANHVPESQYVTEQLATADGGLSYGFSAEPLGGNIEIRRGRTGALLTPGPDWDMAADFVISADGKIRFPGGKAKTLELWGRYVPTPGIIDSGTEPTLKPTFARSLLVPRALYLWACRPTSAVDPAPFLQMEAMLWAGNPQSPGETGVMGTLKNQFFLAGSASIPSGSMTDWWRSIDTGDGYVVQR